MPDVPQSTRDHIIALHLHTSKSKRQIARDVGVSEHAVRVIIRQFNETGQSTNSRKGKCGRKMKLSTRERRAVVREARKNPSATAGEIQSEVPEIGNKVSCSTIKKVLRDSGLRVYKPIKTPRLDSNHRSMRKTWASELKDKSAEFWAQVWHFTIVKIC